MSLHFLNSSQKTCFLKKSSLPGQDLSVSSPEPWLFGRNFQGKACLSSSAEMVSCCSLLARGRSGLECYFQCSPLDFQPLAIWGSWGKACSLPLRKVSERDHLVMLVHITTILAFSKILFLPVERFNALQGSCKHIKLTSVFPGQAAAESFFWWRHGCSWLEVASDEKKTPRRPALVKMLSIVPYSDSYRHHTEQNAASWKEDSIARYTPVCKRTQKPNTKNQA